MSQYFEAKVKYLKEDDKGLLKSVTEAYLLDAVSFTEVEAKLYKKMGERVRGEFNVTTITRSNISELFLTEEAFKYYKCKITYSLEDTDSGKEKKISQYFLVEANDIGNARELLVKNLNNMLVVYDIPSIIETSILEIFKFESKL